MGTADDLFGHRVVLDELNWLSDPLEANDTCHVQVRYRATPVPARVSEIQDAGPDSPQLQMLRKTAGPSRDAVYAGDFTALGQAMQANTQAQQMLNPFLVSQDAQQVIAIAREHGALGWKVNGAGGEGGTVTLLCNDRSSAKRAMLRDIEAENTLFKNIPIYLSRYGLRRWEG